MRTLYDHIRNKLGSVPTGNAKCKGCGSLLPLFALTQDPTTKIWRCGHCWIDATRIASAAPAVTWDDVRAKRNQLLAGTDWTQLTDIDENTKTTWQPYRQALRDILTKFSSPGEVQWPDPPNK